MSRANGFWAIVWCRLHVVVVAVFFHLSFYVGIWTFSGLVHFLVPDAVTKSDQNLVHFLGGNPVHFLVQSPVRFLQRARFFFVPWAVSFFVPDPVPKFLRGGKL